MNIIFDKAFSRQVLVSIFRKQSSRCEYCNKKVTEKNLGMVVKTDNGMKARCNSLVCLLRYIDERDKDESSIS